MLHPIAEVWMVLPGFAYDVRGQTLVVSGYLDERVHFSAVGPFDAVDMQGVSGFSSLGLRQFLQFLYGREEEVIHLIECPVTFIETINAISGLLKGTKIAVSSMMVPYRCDSCPIDVEIVLQRSDVTLDRFTVTVPPQKCHRCREPLRLLVDPLEYFVFLYN